MEGKYEIVALYAMVFNLRAELYFGGEIDFITIG
jgi:hypothetical protein